MTAADGTSRRWIAVLAAMVVLTVATVAAYAAAPFEEPPNRRADTAVPGSVAPEHRIVATDDGAVVLVDARSGAVAEIITDALDPLTLDVGSQHEEAYVLDGRGTTVAVVAIRSGAHHIRARAATFAVGELAFPQLPRPVERPRVPVLAFPSPGARGDALVVENLVTGDRHRIDASSGDVVRSIDVLAWSPFGNEVFGVADDGRTLFRIDGDRARTLDEAFTAEVPAGVGRVVDITPLADGVAAVVDDGAATEIVAVGRDLEIGDVLVGAEHRPRRVDADPAATDLLVVTADGSLLVARGAAGSRVDVEQLAEGFHDAAW